MTITGYKVIHVAAYSYRRKFTINDKPAKKPVKKAAKKKPAKKPVKKAVVVKRSSVPAPGSMAARWAADSEIYGVRAPSRSS